MSLASLINNPVTFLLPFLICSYSTLGTFLQSPSLPSLALAILILMQILCSSSVLLSHPNLVPSCSMEHYYSSLWLIGPPDWCSLYYGPDYQESLLCSHRFNGLPLWVEDSNFKSSKTNFITVAFFHESLPSQIDQSFLSIYSSTYSLLILSRGKSLKFYQYPRNLLIIFLP